VITGRDELKQAYQDDQVAQRYVANRFETPLGLLLHRSQVRAVQDVIRANGIRQAIEIAPGPARVTVDVAGLLDGVTIVDSSLQMLGVAARRLEARGLRSKVRFVQGDAFNLPLLARSELVYSFRLIRHFERADRVRLYRSVHDVLAPGGRLVFDAVNEVVSAPLRARAAPGEYEHYDALLRPAEIEAELHDAGFALESLVGVQHRYPALQRCQILLGPRSPALARAVMAVIDRTGGEPLEWVVVCRRA
jgi:ubiquinone/menaquinone biosynthesis C-methylase UbiE